MITWFKASIKTFATEPDILSLIPDPHMVEKTDSQKLSYNLHTYSTACTCGQTGKREGDGEKKMTNYNRRN